MARVREARALVEGLLGQISAEVSALPGPAMRAMAPILHQAEAELSRDLAKWLRTVENGEARFGAQQLRVALVQIRGAMRQMRGLNPALFDVLVQANGPAGSLALGHLARQAERFSMLFEGSLRPLPIQPAAVLARGDRLLIRRFRASSARYGEWAATEIQRQLAVGVVRGETFDQMIKRIQRLSPTARSVAGMVKGPGQTADDLARVLGERIRNRAELIVRTEVINAYNAHAYDGIAAAAEEDEGYRMRWDAAADSRLCPWCRSLDGKVAKVDEEFERGVEHPPLHPRCRCALTPWHVEWGESPALGAPVRHGQGPTEEELAAAAAAEQERVRAAQQAEMERRLREIAARKAAEEAAARTPAQRGESARFVPGTPDEATRKVAGKMARAIQRGSVVDEAAIRRGFREFASSRGIEMPEFRARAPGKDSLRVLDSHAFDREVSNPQIYAFHVGHSPNHPERAGSVVFNQQNIDSLKRGLAAIESGQVGELNRLALAGDRKVMDDLYAVHLMMHETLHGLEATGGTMGLASAVSEVSVELSARFLSAEVLGIDAEAFGAYDELIGSMTKEMARLGGWSEQEAGRRLRAAAKRMFVESEWNVYATDYAARLGRNLFGDTFDQKTFFQALERVRGLVH